MHSTLLALVVVMLGITATLSAPLKQRQGNQRRGPETREEQIDYLRRFGHWRGPKSDTKGTDKDLRRSLMAFQRYSGLKVTGDFDDDTKKLMAIPRCGVIDDDEASGRRKRYTFYGTKWPKTALTYRIVNYTPDLPTDATRSAIIKAFKSWSDVSPMTFKESNTSQVNITMEFVSGDHGDGSPFNGAGDLGHADGYPQGMVHFNEGQQWSLDPSSYSNLLWTATHEIGHVLGLHHPNLTSAIMYGYCIARDADYTLGADDIEGIQFLYGKPLPTIMAPNENPVPSRW